MKPLASIDFEGNGQQAAMSVTVAAQLDLVGESSQEDLQAFVLAKVKNPSSLTPRKLGIPPTERRPREKGMGISATKRILIRMHGFEDGHVESSQAAFCFPAGLRAATSSEKGFSCNPFINSETGPRGGT